ncbi:hypothetical protein N7E02_21775 [Aliirhizobium terrae]|uniref:hypothetical protein n=1 Tax=Terrirhizobium terrae TaxID=2926709 RepID=UPI002576E89B|nr:hypothetical protein [Rhizobium sp. CC-CFT758]WJH39433.1 hypothetical protein N7E02_21775 [Rhizobium sp. CC-CFT758]
MSAAGASQAKDQTSLKSGDGGGIFTDMETRLTKLEEAYEDTRSTLNTIMGHWRAWMRNWIPSPIKVGS